jgi:hypothetical protein
MGLLLWIAVAQGARDADTAVGHAILAVLVQVLCDGFHGPVSRLCDTGCVTTATYTPRQDIDFYGKSTT